MFGYITAAADKLTEEERNRYSAVYCGLCRSLKERHGQLSRLTLNYDMTLLILVLSSLYEPEEQQGSGRCIVHPGKKRDFVLNQATEYAADLNLLLAWWNCMDDWEDDRNLMRLCFAKTLGKECKKLEKQYPRQSRAIRETMTLLKEYEDGPKVSADRAADCFGDLMGELFAWKQQDYWAKTLRQMGQGLGRFIYIMDACIDYPQDERKNRPNPLRALGTGQRDSQGDFDLLCMLMADATEAFERLPLEQDLNLMRNILYAGAWQKYHQAFRKRQGKMKENDKELSS